MRHAPPLLGLALASAFGGPALAQDPFAPPSPPAPAAPAVRPPDVRFVITDTAEVRCGPSLQMYPTNVLRKGDKVEVQVEGTTGWLAIRPPRGSFSWVNTRFLQAVGPGQPIHVVAPEGAVAEVVVGSSLKRDRPDVIGTRLQRGAQVRAIGPGLTDRDGGWLPIEPPPGEVRYIPAQAVAKTPPAAAPMVAAGAGAFTGAAAAATPAAPPNPDSLWRMAVQAERNGQTAEAIRLYQLAGTANLGINPARAMEAFDRARLLNQQGRPAVAPGGYAPVPPPPAGSPPGQVHYTASSDDRLAPVGADSSGATVRLAAPNPPAYSPPDPLAAGNVSPSTSTSRGWLRRAGRSIDSHPQTYVLDNAQGLPLYYVTAVPGVDLGPYVNHYVELSGTVSYRGELRAHHMTAAHVQVAQ
jgi:hypothetical protein